MEIDGVVWVRKETKTQGLDYCVVRTYSAGVYAGFIKEQSGQEAKMVSARMIYSWKGALSTLELANGNINIEESKLTESVENITLTNVIACIKCNAETQAALTGARAWKI